MNLYATKGRLELERDWEGEEGASQGAKRGMDQKTAEDGWTVDVADTGRTK